MGRIALAETLRLSFAGTLLLALAGCGALPPENSEGAHQSTAYQQGERDLEFMPTLDEPVAYWSKDGAHIAIAQWNEFGVGCRLEPTDISWDTPKTLSVRYVEPELEEHEACPSEQTVFVDEFIPPDDLTTKTGFAIAVAMPDGSSFHLPVSNREEE